MTYSLSYHPEVARDIAHLPKNISSRIQRAIEERLLADPVHYGHPLRRSLQGYRKLRVGDYRVIYKIKESQIIIFKIGHRKEVYLKIGARE